MKHEIQYIIFGPLRAGTTMFRLMLKNHPRISNPGEFDYLFTAARPANGSLTLDRDVLFHHHGYHNFGFTADETLGDEALLESLLAQVTAKKPGIQTINVHHRLDTAVELLEGVKVIKLHRDPRDVARSSLPMGFEATLYHCTQHWIDTERVWDRVKAKLPEDRYLELRFEDLVSDPQGRLAEVCAFMGIDYDPAMLDYGDSSTYEAPDASVAYKWKRSMSAADAALCSCRAQELIRSRGYDVPEGAAAPGGLARLRLELANKLGKWRFQFRRYGVGLTLGEKVTRWLGMREQNNRFRDKRNRIVMQYLK